MRYQFVSLSRYFNCKLYSGGISVKKEIISDKQGISLIIMFLIGTTTLSVFGTDAKESFWIPIILALFMEFLIVLIFIRFNYIFPNKDLFDIIEICFGKYIGKVIMVSFIYFLLEDTLLIVINFGMIISITTLTETPEMIIRISIMILCSLAIKKGIEVMGRWAEYIFIIFIISILISILLSIPNMNIDKILPILDIDLKSVLKGTFKTFTFPFGEIIAFTMAFSGFKTKKSSSRIYIIGLLIGGIILLITSFTNILVLGINMSSNYYYPAYATFTKIHIGNFIQRIEVLLAVIFVLGSFVKISVCFLATIRGIAKIFKFNDYRFLITPIALIILNISHFYTEGIMEFWKYIDEIWSYYALLFEMIFPIIFIIIAEIKKKKWSEI